MISLLLVDHEPPSGDGFRSSLNNLPGCRVVAHASNVPDALSSIRQRQPDVVVIGAGPAAVEAARLIRTDASFARVLLILPELTAKQLMLALEAGIHGIVSSDADQSALAAAVRAVNAGVNYLSQEAADALVGDYLRRTDRNGRKAQFDRLSRREKEVLRRMVSGESMAGIAEALNLSPKTVETYRRRAMAKLDVKTKPMLVQLARTNHLSLQ